MEINHRNCWEVNGLNFIFVAWQLSESFKEIKQCRLNWMYSRRHSDLSCSPLYETVIQLSGDYAKSYSSSQWVQVCGCSAYWFVTSAFPRSLFSENSKGRSLLPWSSYTVVFSGHALSVIENFLLKQGQEQNMGVTNHSLSPNI